MRKTKKRNTKRNNKRRIKKNNKRRTKRNNKRRSKRNNKRRTKRNNKRRTYKEGGFKKSKLLGAFAKGTDGWIGTNSWIFDKIQKFSDNAYDKAMEAEEKEKYESMTLIELIDNIKKEDYEINNNDKNEVINIEVKKIIEKYNFIKELNSLIKKGGAEGEQLENEIIEIAKEYDSNQPGSGSGAITPTDSDIISTLILIGLLYFNQDTREYEVTNMTNEMVINNREKEIKDFYDIEYNNLIESINNININGDLFKSFRKKINAMKREDIVNIETSINFKINNLIDSLKNKNIAMKEYYSSYYNKKENIPTFEKVSDYVPIESIKVIIKEEKIDEDYINFILNYTSDNNIKSNYAIYNDNFKSRGTNNNNLEPIYAKYKEGTYGDRSINEIKNNIKEGIKFIKNFIIAYIIDIEFEDRNRILNLMKYIYNFETIIFLEQVRIKIQDRNSDLLKEKVKKINKNMGLIDPHSSSDKEQ